MLSKYIAASVIFIPNFIFWSESGYFDYVAAVKLLLHLWSLGIEEQFFLCGLCLPGFALNIKISLVKVGGGIFIASLLINLLMCVSSWVLFDGDPESRLFLLLRVE